MDFDVKELSRLVLLERLDDGVAILTVNNPPLNLFTLSMTRAFGWRLREIAADPSIRSVVVTGSGTKAFGAGSDIKEFEEMFTSGQVIDRKLRYENEVFSRLEELPQPSVAAIQGVAFGGGCELALCCDLRVAGSSSRIALPEVKLGVFPGSGGLVRLPKLIGETRAKELMYLGDPISAEQALAWGLLNKVVPDEDVLCVAIDLARQLASRPAVAIQAMKKGIRENRCQERQTAINATYALSERVFASNDVREGVDAFFAKRAPQFTHR